MCADITSKISAPNRRSMVVRWPRFGLKGIRSHLAVLILLAGLPVLGVAVLDALDSRQSALEAARKDLQVDVLAARDDLAQGIRTAGYLLGTFSRIPAVVQGRAEGCALLGDMARSEGRYASFLVADSQGRAICGSSPEHVGTSYADREHIRAALGSHALAIGRPLIGRAMHKPLIPMSYAVRDDTGNVVALLVGAIDLPWYGERFARGLHGKDTSLTLWDAEGRLLYRYPDNDYWIGKQPDMPIARAVAAANGTRTVDSIGVDGIKRLYALTTLGDYPHLGVTLSIGVSENELFIPANLQFLRSLLFLALTAVLGFSGASWLAQRLVAGPVSRLVDASQRLAAGEQDVAISEPHPVGELGALTATFNETAAAIQSHRKRLEELVRQRTAELEATNAELEAFSYSVSHDLRAPLRHMAGFVELLSGRLRTSPDAKTQHYLHSISEASREMDRLIQDLLTFARTGRAEMREAPVDTDQVVADVVKKLGSAAEGRNIEWRLRPLPAVLADPNLLAVVITNLLDNALKYTRLRNPAFIEFGSFDAEGDRAVIFVRDNGTGFDMRYAGKLFGVFERLHSSEEFEGTGIGLATVRRIITRHGGRVWAEARPDEGATFFFTLKKAAHDGRIAARAEVEA